MPTATPSYVIQNKVYVLRDEPDTTQPLRRLQKEGVDVVKIKDLLQIALGKIDNVEQFLHEYGIQSLARLQRVEEIKEILHLDDFQATRLLAILGLGKRLYSTPQEPLPTIRGIEDVYTHCRSMANLAKEQLRVLLVNSRYQLVYEELIAIGGSEWLRTTPKDLLQPAVARQISSLILVHNHPSGNPTPSQADYMFTEQMQKAAALMGLEILDHVIVAEQGHASCLPSSSSLPSNA